MSFRQQRALLFGLFYILAGIAMQAITAGVFSIDTIAFSVFVGVLVAGFAFLVEPTADRVVLFWRVLRGQSAVRD